MVADDLDQAFTAKLAAALGLHRAWEPARAGDGLGGSPCPLTPGDKPHLNDPNGRSDGASVKRLTIPHNLDGGPQPLRHFPRCGYPVYD